MMTLTDLMILFFTIIIIVLAIKTEMYVKIIILINKTKFFVVTAFILLTPLAAFILFVNISNAICNEYLFNISHKKKD